SLQSVTLILFAIVLSLTSVILLLSPGPASATDTVWKPLRIGAGGLLTGIDISPDGSTRVVRTDTYGSCVWDPLAEQWKQVVTASTMPAVDVASDKNAGVYEIRVAPSLPSRLYMAYGGYVYRSNDRATTWTRTAFTQVAMDANDDWRGMGPKM